MQTLAAGSTSLAVLVLITVTSCDQRSSIAPEASSQHPGAMARPSAVVESPQPPAGRPAPIFVKPSNLESCPDDGDQRPAQRARVRVTLQKPPSAWATRRSAFAATTTLPLRPWRLQEAPRICAFLRDDLALREGAQVILTVLLPSCGQPLVEGCRELQVEASEEVQTSR